MDMKSMDIDDQEEEKLIPEEKIDFEDKRPYHTIEMYKKLVQFHIGLQVRAMTMSIHYQKNTTIKGSFPKPEEIDMKTYKRCDDPDKSIRFPIYLSDVEFKYIGDYECFFMLCLTLVRVFRYQRTLFIVFEGGERAYGIHKLKDTFYVVEEEREYPTINYVLFYKMLEDIKEHFTDINQLVLSGHSNGMPAATIFSYLLCCAKYKTFFEEQDKSDFDELSLSAVEQLKQIPLENITLFVVGTGGFPILFKSKEEFRKYHDIMEGRYVHIVSGYKKDDHTIIIDSIASYLMGLLNVKFSLYYTEILSFYYSQPKYKKMQCNFDVIIDDILLDPEKFTKKDSHMDFYDIYNTDTKNFRLTSEDEIQPLCERVTRENTMYAEMYPNRKKDFEEEIAAVCDYTKWFKKKLGSHDLRFYLKTDDQELYDAPDTEILNIKKDGLEIKYPNNTGFSHIDKGVHQMSTYRSILSIYFFSD